MSDAYTKQVTEWVESGDLTREQADDLLAQKAAFDANRENIEREHKGKTVGYAAGELFVEAGVHELLDKTKRAHPGKMAYFATVGSVLFEEF